MTVKGSFLSIKDDMLHGHLAAWRWPEGYRFADSVLANTLPFVYPLSEPNTFGKVSFLVVVPEDMGDIHVQVVYMKETF